MDQNPYASPAASGPPQSAAIPGSQLGQVRWFSDLSRTHDDLFASCVPKLQQKSQNIHLHL